MKLSPSDSDRAYPTGTIPDIVFTYDAAFQGASANSNKGHVGRITDGIISTEFGHEVTASGPRIKAIAIYPSGRVYAVIEETDFEGNATRTIYPSGREILFDVDDTNRLTRIRVKDSSTFTTLLDQITYAPNGPMLSALYGDGLHPNRCIFAWGEIGRSVGSPDLLRTCEVDARGLDPHDGNRQVGDTLGDEQPKSKNTVQNQNNMRI